jgi:hypothetical protein
LLLLLLLSRLLFYLVCVISLEGIGSLAPAIGGTSFTAISVALTGSVTNSTSGMWYSMRIFSRFMRFDFVSLFISMIGCLLLGECTGSKCYNGTFMFACVTLGAAICLTLLLAYVDEVKKFARMMWARCRPGEPGYSRI